MSFDMTALGSKVRDHRADWESLQVDSSVGPVEGQVSKPLVAARFDGGGWLADVCVWVTGEAELESVRKADGLVVLKHYDLTSADDLDTTLSDLIGLMRSGAVPSDAFVAQA